MSDFDLRGLTDENEDEQDFELPFESDVDNVLPTEGEDGATGNQRFLGMTAVERMMVSVFLFFTVSTVGIAILLFTDRLG